MVGDRIIDDPLDTIPDFFDEFPDERRPMQWLSCVIRPESLEAVTHALNQSELVGGMTVTDVRGFGRQKGHVEHYRGEPYTIKFVPKVRVDIAVRQEDADAVMAAIRRSACTGQVGDGKIFVVDLFSAMRIRTGERGAGVL